MASGDENVLIPNWIKAVFALVLGLFVIINVIYHFGFGGVNVSGADVSFNREFDNALFKVDDDRAFVVSDPSMASLVKYKSGMIPFRPLCGRYELDGVIIHGTYKKGDWLYRDSYMGYGATAYNLKTKEEVKLEPPGGATAITDASTVPLYKENGLVFDDKYKVTVEWVVENHKQIPVINESCFTFNAAFMLIFGLLLISTMIAVPIGLAKRRKQKS